MILQTTYWLTNPPSFLNPLTRREPKNPNAPGLDGNKNGPPGPEGNQNGPPSAAEDTEELGTSTGQNPAMETAASDVPTTSQALSGPADAPSTSPSSAGSDLTSSSAIITFDAPGPPTTSTTSLLATRSAASLASVWTSSVSDPTPTSSLTTPAPTRSTETLFPATSFMLTMPYVETSDIRGFTSVQYNGSRPPSLTVSSVSFLAETTSWSSFISPTSTTAIETGWSYHSPNGTIQTESKSILPGQRAGIATGTIGFFLILTLIYWVFKWRRAEHPKALLRLVQRQPNTPTNSHQQPRSQTFNVMLNSPLSTEAGSSGDPAWGFRATFAGPNVIEKPRQSQSKSLKLLRINPLGMNPVTPSASRTRTPNRKSFASSFFHRRSAASTLRSASGPPSEEQPRNIIGPQSLSPLLLPQVTLPSPEPSAISSRFAELTQSNTDHSQSLTVPPQTLPHPWRHSSSQITRASAERDARLIKGTPGRAKPHSPSRLRTSIGVPQGSEKELPLPPLPLLPSPSISPSSWLRAKVLRRSQSTTTSKDEV
ncbi:uncharacterized protein Z518_03812 [Rhinocladiella mackenziei CBS 650.93]|uniref:Rhinocladiella mackenziei CBS 650.93 unplaced genomic scaffold supercont1.3, whole genome shotgun sequence n=1 Tax=Rhinocladiella mackenziei CBS 650.93 TaxID=1442369 RepID=A0A0D2IJD6_9EURO|nr:uncharacterized protein Z518_03812 [Rhinocladiella mackenziei CBS 650.93]KIX05839.1 hypothetical protein Z518_03812 [Rhinocladiella mackenziei CBS 650.93]